MRFSPFVFTIRPNGRRSTVNFLLPLISRSFVKLILPVLIVHAGNTDAMRRRCVDKLAVFHINTDMLAISPFEKDKIASLK